MANKLYEYGWDHAGRSLWFHCPGCEYSHPFRVESNTDAPVWNWNGSLDKPTFSPSLLIPIPDKRCHSYVRDGNIEFLADCYHKLAGKTVELPDWE